MKLSLSLSHAPSLLLLFLLCGLPSLSSSNTYSVPVEKGSARCLSYDLPTTDGGPTSLTLTPRLSVSAANGKVKPKLKTNMYVSVSTLDGQKKTKRLWDRELKPNSPETIPSLQQLLPTAKVGIFGGKKKGRGKADDGYVTLEICVRSKSGSYEGVAMKFSSPSDEANAVDLTGSETSPFTAFLKTITELDKKVLEGELGACRV